MRAALAAALLALASNSLAADPDRGRALYEGREALPAATGSV